MFRVLVLIPCPPFQASPPLEVEVDSRSPSNIQYVRADTSRSVTLTNERFVATIILAIDFNESCYSQPVSC